MSISAQSAKVVDDRYGNSTALAQVW